MKLHKLSSITLSLYFLVLLCGSAKSDEISARYSELLTYWQRGLSHASVDVSIEIIRNDKLSRENRGLSLEERLNTLIILLQSTRYMSAGAVGAAAEEVVDSLDKTNEFAESENIRNIWFDLLLENTWAKLISGEEVEFTLVQNKIEESGVALGQEDIRRLRILEKLATREFAADFASIILLCRRPVNSSLSASIEEFECLFELSQALRIVESRNLEIETIKAAVELANNNPCAYNFALSYYLLTRLSTLEGRNISFDSYTCVSDIEYFFHDPITFKDFALLVVPSVFSGNKVEEFSTERTIQRLTEASKSEGFLKPGASVNIGRSVGIWRDIYG